MLLVLPCNPCVRLGNYMLCSNWRVVWRSVWDLVVSGVVDLAAVDSCKPGIVAWGEEAGLSWCDAHPSVVYERQPWRREALYRAVARDVARHASRGRRVVYYVNVKVYRGALRAAAAAVGDGSVVEAGPPRDNPLSYNSRASRAALRRALLEAAKAARA